MAQENSGVYLSQFARGNTLRKRQAAELAELVSGEAEWLAGDFPDTVERYSAQAVALSSIKRVAPGVERYIARRAKATPAYGIGTVMRGQTIVHPVEGQLTATDIDYWLGRDGRWDAAFNEAVVRELLKRAAVELKPEAELIMATARPDQPQAEAFAAYMTELGAPSTIAIDEAVDRHAMTKHGATLQLFTVAKDELDI